MKPGADTAFLFTGNEERIHKLLNSLPIGVIVHGPQAEILFSNNVASSILGLSNDELCERSSLADTTTIQEDGTLFPPDRDPVHMAIRRKKNISNVVMGICQAVTNNRIWLQVNAEPLWDEDGEIKEVTCSFSDITERKTSEEKLNWLYQSLEIRALELAGSNADLERFLYVATHDLQEPLRMVNSFTQLLKKKYGPQLDEQANEYISYATDGATRMKKLILDLLEYSKFSSNTEEFAPTDMNSVLSEVAATFSGEIAGTGTELIITTLPVITAKPSLMVQLFEKLIGNALKYRSTARPLIKIDCKDEGDNFLFTISDNGIGIDPKFAETIFLLFRKLHNNSETNEGTGVGLAICKKIAELHHGHIRVQSEQGYGSTFYITIAKKQNQHNEKL